MIMCTGFNCIPNGSLKCIGDSCSEVTLLRAVSRHCTGCFLCAKSGPHFCYPIPSFDKMDGDQFIGSTSPKLCVATVSVNRSKHRPRNSLAKNAMQSLWVENC